jgi:hypothetical protein
VFLNIFINVYVYSIQACRCVFSGLRLGFVSIRMHICVKRAEGGKGNGCGCVCMHLCTHYILYICTYIYTCMYYYILMYSFAFTVSCIYDNYRLIAVCTAYIILHTSK